MLTLRYVVSGAMRALSLPPPATPARADGLWQRTCFEAFLRPGPGEAYYEFNFSPSTEWAAYRFDGYRQGMRPAEGLQAPRIEPSATDEAFELRVSLDLDQVPDLPMAGAWGLGLAAVIEDAGGAISYWALAHPPGKADFHHADGFALNLSAPGAP
ncbi:MAG: DOMON-like domain-containing protein [Phenylobacterium sp.]|uniref:DOMON-like domain-containing protein n=1 Tax=Phenylobacterium sp. TaxID=1871053 RepID=UPI0027327227|nr:DOMON-like domain-containing protein [Phenylobacterium sp.]MDP3746866.1 DOMON-like domain-containing protein [Phenylobacterium sp.]